MPSRAFTTARTHSNSAAISETLGFTPIAANGTVSSANALATARTIALAGDASGSALFDGSANASITVSLANSGVTAGAYTNANVTVDAKGRITAVSNGTSGTISTITLSGDVSGTSSSGNVTVTLATTGVSAGSYTNANVTVDAKGRVTTVSNGTITLTGDVSGTSSTGNVTVTLANSGVTAGAYTNANVTVDAKGRITSIANGAAGGGTLSTITLSGDASGTSSNTGNIAVTLANSGVTAGTYGSSSAVPVITVDGKGRVTNVSTSEVSGGGGGTATGSNPRTIQRYTATAGQTTFTFSTGYTVGQLDVYVNGVRLDDVGGDFTATNGSTFVISYALNAGDTVIAEVSGSGTTPIYASYTANSVNTFTLPATITSNAAIVTVNGLVQDPTTHYSISGTTLTINDTLSSSDVVTVRSLSTTSVSFPTYATVGDLPASASTGQIAFVLSNNKLYVWNSGWYSISALNLTPTFTSIPNSVVTVTNAYALYTATIAATDPDGFGVTLGMSVVSGVSNSAVTFNATTGAFTANFSAVMGNAVITFTATDGTNIASQTTTFVVAETYWSNVSVLIPQGQSAGTSAAPDISNNNLSITRYGTSVYTTARGAPNTPAEGNWSVYFNGSTDYLTVPYNGVFNFGTGDFTLECWANLTNAGRTADANKYGALMSGGAAANSTGLWLVLVRIEGSYITEFLLEVNGTVVSKVVGLALPVSQWHHYAVSRSGTTVKLFTNGTNVKTDTSSVSIDTNSSGSVVIGQFAYGGTYVDWIVGSISNLRIVKGTAVYTSNFTPSTTPLTNIANTSLLTCQSYRLKDNSSYAFAVTRNGSTYVAPENPFSAAIGTSILFGGADYLATASSALFDLGSDWTIEGWYYFTSFTAANPHLWQIGSDSNTRMNMYRTSADGKFNIFYSGSVRLSTTTVPTPGQWYHIAATFTAGVLRVFVNGNLEGTLTGQGTSILTSANRVLAIGVHNFGAFTSGDYLNGYVADFRVTKGYARYTATFTPPTRALSRTGP